MNHEYTKQTLTPRRSRFPFSIQSLAAADDWCNGRISEAARDPHDAPRRLYYPLSGLAPA